MYTIETERLLLRELRASDAAGLVRMLGDATVTAWLFAGQPMTEAEARAFIEREFVFGRSALGLGLLCERESGAVVGFAGLIPCTCYGTGDVEFGFALKAECWGRGYATESGRAQLEFGFRELGLERMLALAHPDNSASLQVLEKLGMTFVTDVRCEQRGPRRVYVAERPAALDAQGE